MNLKSDNLSGQILRLWSNLNIAKVEDTHSNRDQSSHGKKHSLDYCCAPRGDPCAQLVQCPSLVMQSLSIGMPGLSMTLKPNDPREG